MRNFILGAVLLASATQAQNAPKPEALNADGIPPVPMAVVEKTRPYLEFRSGSFQGWNPARKSALILTRFGNTPQVHEVTAPGGDRRQLSFEADTIADVSAARDGGDVTVVQKDVGGNEFWQLYTLANGRLTLLTDGKSRNILNAWSRDGRWLTYSSTRRNGADSDLYVIDPRDPRSDRLVATVTGGQWRVADIHPDGRRAIAFNALSINKADPYLLDLQSGTLTPIGDHKQSIYYGAAEFAPDGTLWVTSDEGSDFRRLGTLDPRSGRFTAVAPATGWDVEEFGLSPDGRWIAYTVNEAGISRLRLLDVATRQVRDVAGLPRGVISSLHVAPWGTIGLTVSSARATADTYAVDPKTLAVTRWTESEAGGLDLARNSEPELIKTKSFDGLEVSGFLYRPDPSRFPGKRPLIISIHGGPEGQFTPGFIARNNYLLNELGIAIFFPNVRGSSGFGKRFVAADNGPFKREDSVKDIGAFLDTLQRDPTLDATRVGVTGGSYGGYMCYASAIHFPDRFKAAHCAVAISNWVTFLENTAAYRRDMRRAEYGDERDPKQRAKLLAISPMTRVAELKMPLYVVTGGNDPRVPASEADQIVKAVRQNGREAWHLLAADEGHGFTKKANQDYYFWTTILYWQRHLLGEQ